MANIVMYILTHSKEVQPSPPGVLDKRNLRKISQGTTWRKISRSEEPEQVLQTAIGSAPQTFQNFLGKTVHWQSSQTGTPCIFHREFSATTVI